MCQIHEQQGQVKRGAAPVLEPRQHRRHFDTRNFFVIFAEPEYFQGRKVGMESRGRRLLPRRATVAAFARLSGEASAAAGAASVTVRLQSPGYPSRWCPKFHTQLNQYLNK